MPIVDMLKYASPRWVKLLRGGKLSPQATQRVTAALPEGSFRHVRQIGQGSFNLADLVAGNVGGRSGLMVRKLPNRITGPRQGPMGSSFGPNTPLSEWYKPLVSESARIERVMPGQLAPYFAATPKGVFQELATRNVIPGPTILDRLRAWWAKKPADQVARQRFLHRRNDQLLFGHGIGDLHPGNISQGGQVIDFAASGKGPVLSVADLTGRPRIGAFDVMSMPTISRASSLDRLNDQAVHRYWAQAAGAGRAS